MNRPDIKSKMAAIYADRRGMKWVSNETKSLQVRQDDIQFYLNNGYHLGRKKGGGTNE